MSAMHDVVVTTAADSGYFAMFQGMLQSLRSFDAGRRLDIRAFDLGLEADQRAWLERAGVTFAQPKWHLGLCDGMMPHWHLAEIVRPFVRDYFPGYRHYMWLDPDLWLQDGSVIERLIGGSEKAGAAIAHEADSAYRFQAWHFAWCLKHRLLGLGLWHGALLMIKPALNCGVYCIAADAPHWQAWCARLKPAIERTHRVAPHSQFTFNQIVYADRLPTEILDSSDNWICDRAPPVWHEEKGVYCKPYAPYKPISLLHLAGPAKTKHYTIKTTSGAERRNVSLHYPLHHPTQATLRSA
ncbi:MAG: hypothetical protein OEU92_27050 [Alphaproteobacteria bacterium]|nr:hypothetical protein [Alphaproteobacteria bacterium]